jgi:hypothetical protein
MWKGFTVWVAGRGCVVVWRIFLELRGYILSNMNGESDSAWLLGCESRWWSMPKCVLRRLRRRYASKKRMAFELGKCRCTKKHQTFRRPDNLSTNTAKGRDDPSSSRWCRKDKSKSSTVVERGLQIPTPSVFSVNLYRKRRGVTI